ncbi:zinc-binding domain-containing protein [Ampelomyces quisqualis]|uniref:Zinc-binding domain-containing protein n=1 Tax=Ampelomyces quisqualis TaxID=50730 RepID=A0A6A5QWT6_AMPQU|nr:zinc-binding domain-containing protein [Ampelomyces quisqualis]
MSPRCVPCDREFSSDQALQQHERDSLAHKYVCTTCDRHFRNDKALAQHYQDAPVHAQSFKQPATLATPQKQKPSTKRKSTMKPKPIKKWSMYPSLHNEVSDILEKDNLSFSFYERDEDNGCIEDYDTNIMGQFTCRNSTCLAVWTSKQIAITIRGYSNERYNARVYYQSCKRCRTTSEPQLDYSYAERVAYRLKKWSGVQVERPPFSGQSDGPHRSDLCEGCRQGHCSKMNR